VPRSGPKVPNDVRAAFSIAREAETVGGIYHKLG
jgi:hypothetical protein